MNFLATSRRDDFVSMFYMIMSLLNHNFVIKEEGPPQSVGFRPGVPVKDQFTSIKNYKKQYSLREMVLIFCKSHEKYPRGVISCLTELADLIENLEFQSKPQYSKIKNNLKVAQATLENFKPQ